MSFYPSKTNYTILKADLFGRPAGEANFRSLGNAPAISWTPQVEVLEHFSSRTGVNAKDDETTTQVGAEVSLTLDELTTSNMAFAMQGTISALGQAAATGEVKAAATVAAGEALDLGAVDVENVVITAGVATLAVGVDYDLYANAGVVLFRAAKTDVTVTFDRPADTAREVIAMLANTGGLEIELMAIGRSPKGKKYKLEGVFVSLRPSGEINFISDEFATIELTGSAIAQASSAFPYGRVVPLT